MKCDCCGKRKKLTESYEEIKADNSKLHLCVDCSNDLYNMRDSIKEGNTEEYEQRKSKLEKKAKKASAIFNEWYKQFLGKINDATA